MAAERDIDPRIQRLKSTTFCGKRLTRRQIADIQETVGRFPQLSRTELGQTLCEHLGWHTPKGRNRIQLAMRVLEQLEQRGILTLPAKQGPGRGRQKPVEPGRRSDPQPAIAGPLAELRPLRLEVANGAEAVAEWNEWVQRYHPLGYRQPIGAHLRYFLLDRQGRKLGCLLFDFAARQLACRDAWIGWEGAARRKPLERVVRNARYLLFPWVSVKNLASHALGLAPDWQRQHGSRPVLAETYTDPERHRGTCYKAANWQRVGRTQGSPAKGGRPTKPPKDVWLYPLRSDWWEVLLGRPSAARPRRPAAHVAEPSATGAEERFTRMWQEILSEAVRLASEHDREWIRRRRVLNTLLVVLFVFRLVFAPDRQGWRGHRAFAVDGSKLNLPRPLVRDGYRQPAEAAHYPQGLLSCLFQLRARLPGDFGLHAHGVVVYDRGYYSFRLLHAPAACASSSTPRGRAPTCWPPPCSTAAAIALPTCPTCTMPDGESKSCTRFPSKC